jgi:hypothetical protein
MVGKIMIAKSLIIPNITYVASVTNIDKEYVSKFKTMIYKFIWNDKREKVKRETMNKNYLEGGLNMIDINKYIEAIQIKRVKNSQVYILLIGKSFLSFTLKNLALN